MSSLLDIDLDYFCLLNSPVERLRSLLAWAGAPVAFITERHNKVLPFWKTLIKRHGLAPPTHLLHVDEHHDMMDDRTTPNIGNLMRHAMTEWPKCRVYWMVDERIDSPGMWLADETWDRLRRRFQTGREIPLRWPKPDLVTVCTSPEFVKEDLRRRLMEEVRCPLPACHPHPMG
jgi:hypothetical protein